MDARPITPERRNSIPLASIVGFNEVKEPLVVNVTRPSEYVDRNEEDTYAINLHPKGYVLIIDNTFESDLELERKGSEYDVQNLSALHTQLGYKVQVEKNVSSEKLPDVIEEFQLIFSSGTYESCFMYILSHGTAHSVQMSDGTHVQLGTGILQRFSDRALESICPRLIHIPKIFVIATCQVVDPNELPEICDPNANISPYSHVYVLKAAMTATFAFRTPGIGTWFIHALCQEIMENAIKHDFDKLVTNVQKRMKQGTGTRYQIPEPVKYCFDKFYFRVDPQYRNPNETDS